MSQGMLGMEMGSMNQTGMMTGGDRSMMMGGEQMVG